MTLLSGQYTNPSPSSFILKTKEQRAAEKALLDKSPLKTLTIEEFLESERHKLTGTLTPVTPESFAKWKKDRLDKKAAEEQLRKAKEATGRALFESGNWKMEDDDEDGDDDDIERLRQETEAIRDRREEERLALAHGYQPPSSYANDEAEPEDEKKAEQESEEGSQPDGKNGPQPEAVPNT